MTKPRAVKWSRNDWEAFAFAAVYVSANVTIIAWFACRLYDLGVFAIFGLAP